MRGERWRWISEEKERKKNGFGGGREISVEKRDREEAVVVASAGRFKSGVRLTSLVIQLLLLWPLTTMKMRRQRSTSIRRERKCEGNVGRFPPNNVSGKVLTGTEPGEWKIRAFFTHLYHCNEPEWTRAELFAGRCYNVHVRSRYGKIEKRAREGGREEGRVFISSFSVSLLSISH